MVDHSKPTLTIFTDASLSERMKSAGWGGWARGDYREPIFRSGKCEYSQNTSLVELWAVCHMLEKIVREGYFYDEDKSVVIQSDNLHTLNIMHTGINNSWAVKPQHARDVRVQRASRIDQHFLHPLDRIKGCLHGTSIVYLKHIKGHQGNAHHRSKVNEICDRLAKEAVRDVHNV